MADTQSVGEPTYLTTCSTVPYVPYSPDLEKPPHAENGKAPTPHSVQLRPFRRQSFVQSVSISILSNSN